MKPSLSFPVLVLTALLLGCFAVCARAAGEKKPTYQECALQWSSALDTMHAAARRQMEISGRKMPILENAMVESSKKAVAAIETAQAVIRAHADELSATAEIMRREDAKLRAAVSALRLFADDPRAAAALDEIAPGWREE